MTSLHRKLERDILHIRGQAVAIALVIACGVAAFVTMRAMYHSLLRSQSQYYRQYRFAEIFADLKRAPDWVARRVGEIPGVATAQARIVMEVTLSVPGLEEPAVGRLISLSSAGSPSLNALFLRRGRSPELDATYEAVSSEAFAAANHLELGSKIEAVIHGRWQKLTIVGIALSPEYIYEIQGSGSLFPDNRHFGVLWVTPALLESALDMKGAFNSISVSLQRTASEAEVITSMDRMLDRYGGLGAYPRSDQISHRFISDEISQNRITSIVIPAIFLAVASLLVHLSFTRLVNVQRSEIAVIKAFGYTNWQVGIHYVQFSLAIASAGYLLGCAVGWYFGAQLAALYAEFYRFPLLIYQPEISVFIWAGLISALTAVAGAIGAVRRATRLPAAEAMRPEAPAHFRRTWMDRLNRGCKSAAVRMLFRNLERRPWRALASVFAISSSVMIVVVEFGMFDSLDRMMELQFREAQREDLVVSLTEAGSSETRAELSRLPGVIRIEPFRTAPARLRFGHRSRKISMLGLEPDGQLRLLVNQDGNRSAFPPAGLVLSTALAKVLHVSAGDTIGVEFLEGRRIHCDLPVSTTVEELLGTNAYINLFELNRLLREDHSVSGAFLQVDQSNEAGLYRRVKQLPGIATIGIREAEVNSFKSTINRSMALSLGTLIVFASVIAAGMIYNGARIALSERARELATLRVVGFTRREVTIILLGEQALIALAALPFGFVAGYGLCAVLAARIATELYRMPLIVQASSYGWALLIVLVSALLSGLLVSWRIARLDIAAVLKARE